MTGAERRFSSCANGQARKFLNHRSYSFTWMFRRGFYSTLDQLRCRPLLAGRRRVGRHSNRGRTSGARAPVLQRSRGERVFCGAPSVLAPTIT